MQPPSIRNGKGEGRLLSLLPSASQEEPDQDERATEERYETIIEEEKTGKEIDRDALEKGPGIDIILLPVEKGDEKEEDGKGDEEEA
jgi:hypothetical protein